MVFIEKVFNLLAGLASRTGEKKIAWEESDFPGQFYTSIDKFRIIITTDKEKVSFRINRPNRDEPVFEFTNKELYCVSSSERQRNVLGELVKAIRENLGVIKENAADAIVKALEEM